MSIAVLTQVYDEARRLAVAGSAVARGDFRLKKLLPPLDQAGAKAPVFAKVADAARAVVDGPEEKSAESLLELAALVTAVLYTQGETGCPGPLEPVETTELGGTAAPTSARLLKPLLEALSSTGSGRLELVKDANRRGAFRDLRLVKPALDGLDDPYQEIADFLAETVVPIYGQAVLPELRAKYDPKGSKGHPRRLRLMHALDPDGTRELVRAALDTGSKEVKVAAIACLGAAKEDLSYLIEQAGTKSQDVRAAVYHALAVLDDPTAATVLEKALAGKDLESAARAISRSKNPKLSDLLVSELRKGAAELSQLKDKKKVSASAGRLVELVRALPAGDHPTANALALDLFARRAELSQAKGETTSGADIVEAVIARLACGPKPLQVALARAHAELDVGTLPTAVRAGRAALPAAEVFDRFAPYLEAKGDAKKKGKGANAAQQKAILDALDGGYGYWDHDPDDDLPPLDPRWLDLAVRIKHLGLVRAVGHPGHPAAEAFVQAEFDNAFAKAKTAEPLFGVVAVMVRLGHPSAVAALVAACEKSVGIANTTTYWFHRLIPELPKSAIPLLETVIPRLKGRETDGWVEAIQKLHEKA